MMLGGIEVAPSVLNQGGDVYRQYCARCHGSRGNGRTTAMRGKRPATDLTLGVYKFLSVSGGGLPTDDDLKRTLQFGLGRGLVMPAFPTIQSSDLDAVVQYIKTLAPRWREESTGTAIAVPANPWHQNEAGALQRGHDVYHLQAKCWTCHPAYVARSALQAGLAARQDPTDVRPALGSPTRVQSVFGPITPPDFQGDPLLVGTDPVRLYRVISVGVPGTAMPSWVDALSAKDRWALVHYVRHLVSGGALPASLGSGSEGGVESSR
jgi:mono/diheme cytochrome c family protein